MSMISLSRFSSTTDSKQFSINYLAFSLILIDVPLSY